ncbi:hypothetical protein Tco_0156641 [Tanacetum coccineum]
MINTLDVLQNHIAIDTSIDFQIDFTNQSVRPLTSLGSLLSEMSFLLKRSRSMNMLKSDDLIHIMNEHKSTIQLATISGNHVKEILLKLNLLDHRSILTDSKVTPTKHGRMTKPYSFPCLIANCFNAGYLKMKVKVPDSSCLNDS